MVPAKNELLEKLALEEAGLAELDRQQQATRSRIEALHAKLAIVPRSAPFVLPISANAQTPTTPAEKVGLFRRLFKGREDVFPTRFVSKKTGKSGYAPACANKFVRRVCELPKVKCGECPNQGFTSVGDQVVLDHLQGRHVMGVYPLLEDETCWFLAVDFDKSSWQEDVGAFVETGRAIDIPVVVERSRSGNGAHAWFFFAAPVAANLARRMGCYLLTETMARRHQLSLGSYDRLFPNQDSMPRGGFGNLIALPLQYEPRQQGNTVFLDDRLEAYSEQWAYLASIPRIAASTVEAIANEATRQGRVVGVRSVADGDEATPWRDLPSGRPRRSQMPGPLPREVHAVLAQRIFVEKVGLPSPLLNEIKRLAAFQNPEFYKKQALRLSVSTTPRVIVCGEELSQHIALPRGCRGDLEALLKEHGVRLVVEDQRNTGLAIDLEFSGELTEVQDKAAKALLENDIGVFVAPPGIGKTVLGTYLAAKRGRSTLVLVHRQPLLDQWVAQLSMFLGIDEKGIGRIGGGKRKPNGRIDVAMIQSLVREGRVDDIVESYGHVIVDECHHVPAFSFERVLAEIKARYIVGLTATPYRRDGHQPILEMQLGSVRFAVNQKGQAALQPFEHRLIVRRTAFRIDDAQANVGIQEIYTALAEDEARNRLIVDDVIRSLKEGRSPILLTERRDHLEHLAEMLRGHARHLVVLKGGATARIRRELDAQLAGIPETEGRLVLATGRYIGEGFDDARLDTLFLAMPVSWKGTLVQYAGRLHRLHPAKAGVHIFDYVDREVPVLMRMFAKRMRTYQAIGYSCDQQPLEINEATEHHAE
ncbi:MAG TPA: DEAD/DEAH box helicase family protein [Thermoanaerobaculia bacterium]|jgi:superfamily II DNA or RNA helicase|nr:DEAD/DEAH box helicase family protein [Thermoanaerobaculia bacterium]